MHAKRFIPERAYICLSAAGRSFLCPFFFFFRRKKGAYVFDSLVERGEGAREPEFFFFVCFTSVPPLWSSKAKGSS